MTVTTSALDAPTVALAVGATRPVPVATAPRGYPAPGAYRVPPLRFPHTPAGSGGAGVPWGPPSGPLPVAPVPTMPRPPVPTMPRPPVPARRGAAFAAVALGVVLLVGGGAAAWAATADGPAEPPAVTWTGATVGS